MFNALKYTKQLEQAGFSREQAETQLQIIGEVLEDDLVTKQDLKLLETKVDNGFERLENRLTIRFAAFLFVGLTALASLIKFWLLK
jgi:hypothetical protein